MSWVRNDRSAWEKPTFFPISLDTSGFVEITTHSDDWAVFMNPADGRIHRCEDYFDEYKKHSSEESSNYKQPEVDDFSFLKSIHETLTTVIELIESGKVEIVSGSQNGSVVNIEESPGTIRWTNIGDPIEPPPYEMLVKYQLKVRTK